jgi:hypothetical protein
VAGIAENGAGEGRHRHPLSEVGHTVEAVSPSSHYIIHSSTFPPVCYAFIKIQRLYSAFTQLDAIPIIPDALVTDRSCHQGCVSAKFETGVRSQRNTLSCSFHTVASKDPRFYHEVVINRSCEETRLRPNNDALSLGRTQVRPRSCFRATSDTTLRCDRHQQHHVAFELSAPTSTYPLFI